MAKFKPGQTGNVKGRPKGTTESVKYRKLLESKSETLIDKLLELAELGSPAALIACIDRLMPKLKPVAATVNVGKLSGTLAERGDKIILAMGMGQIDPDTANTMMAAMAHLSRIVEVDELTRRIEALEGAQANEY